MSNFEFLKDINTDLFKLAQEAENLFKDRYFEQCMTQTRRLGENLCRIVMEDRAKPTDTFDQMLATLKDTPSQSEIEKEFLDDLYFLKKVGNQATHSLSIKNDGKDALECIERAFEASLNFAVFKANAPQELLNKVFDEELLITGKKSKKISLQEEYIAKKKQWIEEEKRLSQTDSPKQSTKKKNKKTGAEPTAQTNKKNKTSKRKKSLVKEFLETILASLIIYIFYLLFYK